jgi:hypothetical protein
MQIDLNAIPTMLDIVHVGLAALALFLLLTTIVLALISISALRRRAGSQPNEVAASVPTPAPNIPPQPPRAESPRPVVVREATPDAALQLLGLLQQEARFIDFLQEEIAGHADVDIGAAVRIVHEGCRKVLKQHVVLDPVRPESENSRITLPKGFDASSVRVSGHIVGEPPFTGTLIHRGWRASSIHLPKLAEGHDARILAPAEVEL